MKKIVGVLFLIAMPLLAQMPYGDHAEAQTQKLFDQLPRELQNRIREVRQSCNSESREKMPLDSDAGLEVADLNGDGSLDIVIDWQAAACDSPGVAGRCSNQGCDLEIYKQTGPKSWKKVFSEQVNGHYESLDYAPRARWLVVTVVGGNSHCKAPPGTPHGMCDALVIWRAGRWQWQPIR
jgi:hypothetical protein